MDILVGDIGGTKTVLGLARADGGGIALDAVRRYPSGAFDCLESLVSAWRAETGVAARRAAFAIAGPVDGRRCHLTNLGWFLDAEVLAARLELARVELLNDLEAVAWGIQALRPEDLAELHPGAPGASGNVCVAAAGTGLGQAGLYWDGRAHRPFATEGGHTDFAPGDDLEWELWRFLRARFGHVSWERLVSGPGIVNVHDFLRDHRRVPTPDWLAAAMAEGDPAGAIAAAADAGRCPLCVETLERFLRLYGRETGNLALKQMALGGVYLGGGIAPRHLERLRAGDFLAAFFDKGRMAPLLQRMPVRVILQPHAPLFGAARCLLERN